MPALTRLSRYPQDLHAGFTPDSKQPPVDYGADKLRQLTHLDPSCMFIVK